MVLIKGRIASGALRLGLRHCSGKPAVKIEKRGIYEDLFPENSATTVKSLLTTPPQCVYAGFDPTSDSLHIGNLLILTTLLRWQRAGHTVIALVGSATGQIGDPSHRANERERITIETLTQNSIGIKRNLETILKNHEEYLCDEKVRSGMRNAVIVDNMEWYRGLGAVAFVKDVMREFRMGTMLGRSSVQARLNSESGMSLTEFCYPVFQAYDWMRLYEEYNCRFQIGGSDQMGNIVSGHDLISRLLNTQVFGLTLPLITTKNGQKFGKSLNNAVWLAPEKSSSFQLYQFFIRTEDSDVRKFLRFFTFLSVDQIDELMSEHEAKPEERRAQKMLAEQVTLLVHGESGLQAAQRVSAALYSRSLSALSSLQPSDFSQAFEGARTVSLTTEPGITLLELSLRAECFKTEHDARRIIRAGGFYVNNSRSSNPSEVVVPGVHILSNNLTLLRTGKRTYHIVQWL